MTDVSILTEALAKHSIEVLQNYNFDINGFMTWGKLNRLWVQDLLNGFVFGDFDTQVYYTVFENEEILPESVKRINEDIADLHIDGIKHKFLEEERETSKKALSIWYDLDSETVINHSYLEKNQIKGLGCKRQEDKLVLPLTDTTLNIRNLLYIDEDGNKKFLGNKKRGCYIRIGDPHKNHKIFVCDDYVTGVKIHEKTGEAVFIAFDPDNIEPVKEALLSEYKYYEIKVITDEDIKKIAPSSETNEASAIPNQDNVDIHTTISNDSQEKNDNDILTGQTKEDVKPMADTTEIKQNIPSGYVLDDSGLYKKSNNDDPAIKISDKIEVLAESRDDDSNNWGKVVRFKDPDNTIKTVVIPYNQFGSNTKELEETLRSKGLRIYKFKELKQYLSDFITSNRIRSVNKVGWYKEAFLFPDGTVIGNNEDTIMYQGSNRTNEFLMKGTLEGWRKNIGQYCQGNSRLILAVSSAFASTLLYITGQENGGLHFVGNSTIGKSTILNVACSVYGDRSFMKTWRATDNGLEGIAATRNDTLLVLDELGELGDIGKAGEIAYMLGNGKGKIRSHKDGSAQKTFTWRLLYLSSSEINLSDCATEAKKAIKAGQEIRLLNIPAQPSENSFGAFETVHDKETGKAFSEYLNSAVNEYHCTAAREFIQCIINDGFEKIANDFLKFLNYAEQKYLPDEADNQVKRAMNRFMIAAFAGEYATKHGITGWNRTDSLNACVTCFNDWIKERGGVKDLEPQKLLEQVRYYLELYSTSRFLDLNGMYRYITNKNGYKIKDEEGTWYFVYSKVFEKEICAGFNFKQAKDILYKKGWLKDTKSETKHIRGDYERLYTLTPKIWSDEDINE